MYPGYKARRKEFRDIFGTNLNTKFVVDYSCAYHKDILHQGRIYVTTTSCCFYSYIFGWENKIIVPWSEVVAVTKEKTAIFIPNAIQISTAEQKYFFASFVDRESSFMMLVRLWQAVNTNKVMSEDEVDQIIACEYGEGDEQEVIDVDDDEEDLIESKASSPTKSNNNNDSKSPVAQWMKESEGSIVIDKVFNRPVSELFRLLYSNDNFYFNFQKERGTTELEIGDWESGEGDRKVREVSYNMELNNPVGPKKCQVKETQVLRDLSSSEKKMFSVDTEADNSGVPYADSFCVITRNCLVETGPQSSRLIAKAEIKFKKDLWGFLKDKIETNAWSGIKNYYSSLSDSLEVYSENEPQKASLQPKLKAKQNTEISSQHQVFQPWLVTTIVIILLTTSVINTFILYRLSVLSSSESVPAPPPSFSAPKFRVPKDQEGWMELVLKQSEIHSLRTQYLKQQLLAATEHVAAAEMALESIKHNLDEWEPFDWLEEGNCDQNNPDCDTNKMKSHVNDEF